MRRKLSIPLVGVLLSGLYVANSSVYAQGTEKTIRWKPGDGEFIAKGERVRELVTNGVYVATDFSAVQGQWWECFVMVMVHKQVPLGLMVDPHEWEVVMTEPKLQTENALPPEEVERIQWKNAAGVISAARRESRVEVARVPTESESTVTDQYGNVVGTISTQGEKVVTTPPERSPQEVKDLQAFVVADTTKAVRSILEPIMLTQAEEHVSGLVCFKGFKIKREAKVVLRIPLDNTVFEFPWTVTPVKGSKTFWVH